MPNEELILSKIDNLATLIDTNNKLVHKRIDADNARHKEARKDLEDRHKEDMEALKEDHIKPVKDSVLRVYIWMGLIVTGFITAVYKGVI